MKLCTLAYKWDTQFEMVLLSPGKMWREFCATLFLTSCVVNQKKRKELSWLNNLETPKPIVKKWSQSCSKNFRLGITTLHLMLLWICTQMAEPLVWAATLDRVSEQFPYLRGFQFLMQSKSLGLQVKIWIIYRWDCFKKLVVPRCGLALLDSSRPSVKWERISFLLPKTTKKKTKQFSHQKN